MRLLFAGYLTVGTVDFEKKKTLVFHFRKPIGKSRVKALKKLRKFMNICWEKIKNYEQLLSTISKFQALFQKFEHYLRTFCHVLRTFWRILERNRDVGNM